MSGKFASETFAPGPDARTVRGPGGSTRRVPDGWELVPPGDAALTRRIKAGGPSWVVQEKKGRRTFSHGVWADAKRIASIRADLESERDDPAYQRKLEAGRARRDKAQTAYVEDFAQAVRDFLRFPLHHHEMAEEIVRRVTAHATPVGSGTVARTQRIPIEKRAESAVIAWMRHQTTAYDHMQIPRVRGKRREVRRMLAERSRELLDVYRTGRGLEDDANCPLRRSLSGPPR
ncbi:MAG: DUF2293 domain-containing protein [Planctomycetota bacterium]